jgi:hypothetical protein
MAPRVPLRARARSVDARAVPAARNAVAQIVYVAVVAAVPASAPADPVGAGAKATVDADARIRWRWRWLRLRGAVLAAPAVRASALVLGRLVA